MLRVREKNFIAGLMAQNRNVLKLQWRSKIR